jgi:hypothetical protein
MTVAQTLLAVLWVGLTLYPLLAGVDSGAGFWDLMAGGEVIPMIDPLRSPRWAGSGAEPQGLEIGPVRVCE